MFVRDEPFKVFFFFNDTATTEIYTLSLHDALPISSEPEEYGSEAELFAGIRSFIHRYVDVSPLYEQIARDRKSTRLNSSHGYISYAVFCLKKKKERNYPASHVSWSNNPARMITPQP